MSHAPSASRSTRRLPALFAALLCSLLLAGAVAGPAPAQSLISPPQTKQEAKEQREAAAEAAADDGDSLSIEAWLAIFGVVLLAGATFYMLRDSSSAVDPERRAAPARPVTPEKTRGVPATMFEGDERPGARMGKAQKRAKAKRQKQARRANRPR